MTIKEELQSLSDIVSNITFKVCVNTFCVECPVRKEGDKCSLVILQEAKNELIRKLGE